MKIPCKLCFSDLKLDKIATTILIRKRFEHTTCPAHLARFHILDNPQCECGYDFGDLNYIFLSYPIHDRTSFYNDIVLSNFDSVLSNYTYNNNIKL